MDQTKLKTEAEAIAEIVRENHEARIELVENPNDLLTGKVPLLVTKAGQVASLKKLLDEYRDEPERKSGTATMLRIESFIAHVNRHKNGDSALFAWDKGDKVSLRCVFDYHALDGQPRFGVHRSAYEFPFSDEWLAWTGANGKVMSQAEFAEFIEARVVDMLDPSVAGNSQKKLAETIGCWFATPARMLELSRGLVVHVNGRVRQQVSLGSGETQFNFATEHTDEKGAPLKVPGALLLGIPVFRGGAPYQVAARLRYRAKESVSWFFELHGHDKVREHAFGEACERATKETGLPLFFGSAEG